MASCEVGSALVLVCCFFFFFFFQAEDGIRDDLVTGVQTCALPILHHFGNDFFLGIVMGFVGQIPCKSFAQGCFVVAPEVFENVADRKSVV